MVYLKNLLLDQKCIRRLQNVFVIYKMYSVPSPLIRFLQNNVYRIISREKLRGGVVNPMLTLIAQAFSKKHKTSWRAPRGKPAVKPPITARRNMLATVLEHKTRVSFRNCGCVSEWIKNVMIAMYSAQYESEHTEPLIR